MTRDKRPSVYEMFAELGEALAQEYGIDWTKKADRKFWYKSVVPVIKQINKKYGFRHGMEGEE